jgi:DNA-binding GntR family transcriptional regulator
LLQSMFVQIKAMRVQGKYTSMHLSQSCDGYEKVLEALRRRDPDLAEREIRRQIRGCTEEIRRFLPADSPPAPRARRIMLADRMVR